MEFIIDAEVFRGHQKYLDIMKMIKDQNLDVSAKGEFQTAFSGYYFPSVVDQEFKDTFFDYMQQCRGAIPTYEEALRYLHKRSSSVHYSFTSKLLHTLNPENPVLDRHIMRLMGYDLMDSNSKTEKRIQHYCNAYEQIASDYQRYKGEPFMQEALAAFDKAAPEEAFKNVSYAKKVDMLLFRLRKERSASLLDYLYETH